MKKGSNWKKALVFSFLLLLPAFLLIFLASGNPKYHKLPYFGPKQAVIKDGKPTGDSTHYQYKDFEFYNYRGKKITQDDFDGKIILVNVLFPTCPSPKHCPVLFDELDRSVYEELSNVKKYGDVHIISHVIDPDSDDLPSVNGLLENFETIPDRWHFVTGRTNPLFDVDLKKGNPAKKNFDGEPAYYRLIFLYDADKHLRGVYSGMRHDELKRITDELWLLSKEKK
jgi:protein SCO1/2